MRRCLITERSHGKEPGLLTLGKEEALELISRELRQRIPITVAAERREAS